MIPSVCNSLAGRTLLILFFGLTFSHIVSILVFTSEKMEISVLSSEQQLLERMAILTHVLCDTPESLHGRIVTAISRNGVPIDLLLDADARNPPAGDNNEALRSRLEQVIGRSDVRIISLQIQTPDWNHPYGKWHRLLFEIETAIIRLMHTEVLDQEWHALIQLPNQRAVLLVSRPAGQHVPLFRHATLSVLIMSGAILLFVLLMVRQMTRAWQSIVQAAELFGQDLYAAPLPETGATEIRHAAQIFNRMNRQIRGFVENQLQVIAAISHDLRTPITQLRLLAEFTKTPEDRGRMLSVLDEMEKMFVATLSFTRDTLANEPKERLNLSSLLAAICNDLAETGAMVQCDEMEKQPYFCRPVAIKRALINLIENAVQYGGRAEVRLTSRPDRLQIEIVDPGAGIPVTEWDNVMRPFHRLEASRNRHTGGVGMGLAIASTVIHDHGGTLQFAHRPTGGFVVRVILPRQGDRAVTV
ncbi:MAG: hypothetical protein HQL80_02625 [Magnetococcales bacterium]|nr:hypothetical protein [Magnetococcales bacterium]